MAVNVELKFGYGEDAPLKIAKQVTLVVKAKQRMVVLHICVSACATSS